MNFDRFVENYFKPRSWEQNKGRPIYEWLGIRMYKKYLPTTGDLVRKRKGIGQIKISRTDRKTELISYEKQTRKYEYRHVLGCLLFMLLVLLVDKKWTLFDWIFLPILNLYVNVYPIFLQRYIRIRILKILAKDGQSSLYP